MKNVTIKEIKAALESALRPTLHDPAFELLAINARDVADLFAGDDSRSAWGICSGLTCCAV